MALNFNWIGRLAICEVAICDGYTNIIDFRGYVCDEACRIVRYQTHVVRTAHEYHMSYRTTYTLLKDMIRTHHPGRVTMYKDGKITYQ